MMRPGEENQVLDVVKAEFDESFFPDFTTDEKCNGKIAFDNHHKFSYYLFN